MEITHVFKFLVGINLGDEIDRTEPFPKATYRNLASKEWREGLWWEVYVKTRHAVHEGSYTDHLHQPHVPTPRKASLCDASLSSHMWQFPAIAISIHMLLLLCIFVVAVPVPSLSLIDLCFKHEAISNAVLARCDVSTSCKWGIRDGFGGMRAAGGEIHFYDSCHSAQPRPYTRGPFLWCATSSVIATITTSPSLSPTPPPVAQVHGHLGQVFTAPR